jgi:hypothetical protein
MRLTGSKGERVAAVVLGALLLVVQLPQIPKLPPPLSGQAVGFDFVWVLLTGIGVWLVLYGLGMIRKNAKPNAQT